MIGALSPMAQRIENARKGFVEVLVERGLSAEDAERAMSTMLRLKVAKLDVHLGRINVSHGIYLELDVLRNAADLAMPRRPIPTPANVSPSASWILRDKVTKAVICETFDPAKVAALNVAKYEAVPIAEYLASLNKPKEIAS